jgi:glycosyltransferase involved in cell wall biosynthesis
VATFISVIIATKDRSGLLAQTLDALAAQTWPVDRGEIVIADNGSTDGTRAVVEAARQRGAGLPVQYIYVAEPGKSAAVNAALGAARGDLLALTDDDVVPELDWLQRLDDAFASGADFVAGRILPRWEAPPPAWMSPALYGVLAIADKGPEPLQINAAENAHLIPIGANMAVRASVVRRLGGLRPDLGKLGGTLRTGEDHEFFLRMMKAGCRGMYQPFAIVHHWVPRERLHRRYFRAWLYQNGRDVARLEAAYPTAVRLLGVPRYMWRTAAGDVVDAIRATMTLDGRRRFAALLRLTWLLGYVRESWAGRAHVPTSIGMQPAEGP